MRLVSMALRNLGRNKRRSLLAVSSVLISIMLIVVMNGLTGGFLGSIVKNYTKNDVGHVNITTKAYRERERFSPVEESIPDSAALAELLRGIPGLGIELVAERIRFGVLLSSGPSTKAALGLAGEPKAEQSLLMLDRSLLPGSAYIRGPGEAILGEALARDLGLGLGDSLKVVTQRADYGMGFKRFRIAGIFKTGVNSLDEAVFQIGLEDARELLGLQGSAQQLLVMIKNYREADGAAAAIEAALAATGVEGLSVRSWTTMGDFPRFVRLAESIYFWAYLVVAFLGAFIITNIMMMVVLERRKEIGLLKSMGMPKWEVLLLFLLEGSFLGAAGSAVGAGLGFAFNLVLGKVGFDMTKAMAGFAWPMDNVVYPTASLPLTLGVFVLGTLVASLVSLLPSRNAARMNPIDAIRSA